MPVIYSYSVYPMYEYMGFTYVRPLSFNYVVFSSFYILLGFLFSPKEIKKPTDLLFCITFFLIYCPSISLMYIVTNLSWYNIFINANTLLLALVIIFFVSKIKPNAKIRLSLKARQFNIAFIFMLLASLLAIFSYYRFSFSNLVSALDISQLYSIRDEFRNITAPTVVKYLFFAASKAMVPLLFLYGLKTKNTSIKLAAIFIQISIFAVSGHKSIFLGLILVWLGWTYYSYFQKVKTQSVLMFLTVFLLLSFSLDYFLQSNFLVNIFSRRMILVPGMLSGMYFEYFTNNDLTYLGYSIFSSFVDYQYTKTPPFIIGDFYFNSDFMSANVNYLASGFAEFGSFGVLIFSSIAVTLYKILDTVATNEDTSKFIVCALLLPTWVLVDSSLLTALMTHGLFLTFILLMLYPKRFD